VEYATVSPVIVRAPQERTINPTTEARVVGSVFAKKVVPNDFTEPSQSGRGALCAQSKGTWMCAK
jgi:hypothetical protein